MVMSEDLKLMFLFLRLYQSRINNCAKILSNLNNIQLTISHLEKCERILLEKVLLHE